MRRIAVLDAPSNLGLRPPTATSVPGCAKAPGALRDQGLLTRLGARDAGCLTPPRYDPGDWRPGDGVAHAPEIAAYSRALADRIGAILDNGEFPVVLGGDCSILIGSGIAMHRLGDAVGGRIGLVFVDGHSDFRHPGNASYVGAAAGEDLALVTGRGQADLAAIESRRPYFRDIDVVVLGIRAQDEYRLDLQAAGIVTRPVPALRAEGAARSAQWARDQLVDCAGYWVHMDVDVLDPAVMPAVDAPDPGGIAFPELELLLAGLVESPHCLGVEITVFDPDYDPDGRYAAEITSAVVSGLSPVRNSTARPDLVAARRDLDGQPAVATTPLDDEDLKAALPDVAEADPVVAAALDDAPIPALPDPVPLPPGPDSSPGPGPSPGPDLSDPEVADFAPAGIESADSLSVDGSPSVDPSSEPAGDELDSVPGDADGADTAPLPATTNTLDLIITSAGLGGNGSLLLRTPAAEDSSPVLEGTPQADPDDSLEPGFEDAPHADLDEAPQPDAVDDHHDSLVRDADSVLAAALAGSFSTSGDTDPVPAGENPDQDAESEAAAVEGLDAEVLEAEGPDVEAAAAADPDVEAVEAEASGAEIPGAGDESESVAGPELITDSEEGSDSVTADGQPSEPGAEDAEPADGITPVQEAAVAVGGDAAVEVEPAGTEPAAVAEVEPAAPTADDAVAGEASETDVVDGDEPVAAENAEPVAEEKAETAEDEVAEPVAEEIVEPVVAEAVPVSRRPEPDWGGGEVRLLSRPLGSAPLLDSEPLPATRPGMLRPRPPVDPPAAESYSPPAAGAGPMGGFPPGAA